MEWMGKDNLRRLKAYAPRLRDRAIALPLPERQGSESLT